MNKTKNEKIYDEEIGTVLMELGKICEKHKMSIFASVEYEPGYFGTTMSSASGSHIVFRFYNGLRKCIEDAGMNVDKFIFGLIKWSRKVGHSSIVMERLGVPLRPEGKEEF